jgi:hypothetical protein
MSSMTVGSSHGKRPGAVERDTIDTALARDGALDRDKKPGVPGVIPLKHLSPRNHLLNISGFSGDEFAAAVDGFELPKSLLQLGHAQSTRSNYPDEHGRGGIVMQADLLIATQPQQRTNHHDTATQTLLEKCTTQSTHTHTLTDAYTHQHTDRLTDTQGAAGSADASRGPGVLTTIHSKGRRASKTDCLSLQNALAVGECLDPLTNYE